MFRRVPKTKEGALLDILFFLSTPDKSKMRPIWRLFELYYNRRGNGG